jgi:DNA topoisomerase-1
VLRELTHEGSTIKLLSGRYGPYVTDGSVNASLPKTSNPDALTYEQALELLAARRDMAPAPKRGAFGKRAVKTTAARKRKTA